jgi:hypothetical protein
MRVAFQKIGVYSIETPMVLTLNGISADLLAISTAPARQRER